MEPIQGLGKHAFMSEAITNEQDTTRTADTEKAIEAQKIRLDCNNTRIKKINHFY